MADLLSDAEIAEGLPAGWNHEGDEIARTFEFEDYLSGIDFVAEAGEIAEEEWHHPEMIVRYAEVEVRFTTHDAGGVTGNDLELAALFNDAYEG